MKTLFHGAAYYPELWPETDIERDIAGMKRLGISIVRMGEFAWAKMEPDEGRASFEFFVRVMDRLHVAGIGVVFCTPTAAPPVWLTYGHPERCFVDEDGRVMSHGARQHASYENPDVRAACLRIAEACGTALGRHPALVAWQIDNELKCHVAEDFNPSAIAHWHEWLANRYGTIERLNAAWGAEIWSERYQRFEQVPAPVRTPFLHNASLTTAWRMFSRESIAEFLDAQCAALRRHSSAPITHNLNIGFSVSLERMCAGLDFAAFDNYPDFKHWSAIVLDNDLFRAAKPGRPHWLMETSVSHNGWLGNHETAHPPGFLVAEAVSSYALGAAAVCYWLWRQQRTGCELPHSAIMSAWFKPSIGYAQVEAVEAARRQLEPLLLASRPAPADVALTWSDLGRAMLLTEPLGANRTHHVSYNGTIGEWHRLLLDAGLHRDVRFEGAALDGLKLLVTPAMPHASPEFLGRVEEFVRAGGVWICAPTTGTRTAEHGNPTDAGLGAIDKLGGVETVFSYPVTGTDAVGEAFGLSAPLAGWCSALRPAGGSAKVVGVLKTELAPGLAFLTERTLGIGAVVVLGALPEGESGKKLLAAIVSHYAMRAGAQRFEVTPGTLVCPRVGGRGGKFWIVVNMDGAGGELRPTGAVRDALTRKTVAAGAIKLGRYEWRALQLA
ncbi:MAG TPA: beta-galactosidase [Opitutus sp.]|nr:beta-galactosidase [Opitutus sp.]